VPGVLSRREMNVQVYDAGGGMTVIMANAMADWEPPRPAAEVIPGDVRAVTVVADWGPTHSAPVTVTSRQAVRQLAALVNGLPLSTLSPDLPCQSGTGATLTFYASPAATGTPAAVATGPTGCGAVQLTLGGRDQPDLEPADASAYRSAVLRIAGLPQQPGLAPSDQASLQDPARAAGPGR
jgi:hypothetical protein